MTVQTIAGSIARVITKLLVYFVLNAYMNAKNIPISRDTPIHAMKFEIEIVSVLSVNTLVNKLLNIS